MIAVTATVHETMRTWLTSPMPDGRTVIQVLSELYAKNRCNLVVTSVGDTFPEPNHPYGWYGLTSFEAMILSHMTGSIEAFLLLYPNGSKLVHESIVAEVRRVAQEKLRLDTEAPTLTSDLFTKDPPCPSSSMKPSDELF